MDIFYTLKAFTTKYFKVSSGAEQFEFDILNHLLLMYPFTLFSCIWVPFEEMSHVTVFKYDHCSRLLEEGNKLRWNNKSFYSFCQEKKGRRFCYILIIRRVKVLRVEVINFITTDFLFQKPV